MWLVLTLPAPVDLGVEELVTVPVIELTPKSATAMIKVLPVKMFQGHSQIMKKPASRFYRLRFLIETKLPTTCSLMIVIIGRYLQSKRIQVRHMHSIASHAEGNIDSKTVPP